MSHVLNSETGMRVSRLMKLFKQNYEIKVQVRWKGLSPKNYTLEPLQNVHKDISVMFDRLLKSKNAPSDLAQQARDALDM